MFHTVLFGRLAAAILVLSLPVMAAVIDFESFLDVIYTAIYAAANSLHEFEFPTRDRVPSTGGKLVKRESDIWDWTPNMRQTGRRSTEAAG